MTLSSIAQIAVLEKAQPGPSNLEQAGWPWSATRSVAAFISLPVLIFAFVLLHLVRTRRWGWLSLYVFGIVFFAGLIGFALILFQDYSSWMPGEHLVLSDLDVLLAFGYYTTGIIATFAVGIVGLQRMVLGPRRMANQGA